MKIRGRSIRGARIIAIDVDDIRRVDTMAQQIADLGFAATFFIDAAGLGTSSQSHALLRSLVRSGMEIGLRGTPWTCPVRSRDGSTETILRALMGGKHLLEDVVGRRVDAYAYPNAGRRCIRSARPWVMQLGFESAATSDWNRLSDDTDLYSVPRCEIAAADTPADFIDKLTSKRDYLRYLPS